jgi:hypothetical protein
MMPTPRLAARALALCLVAAPLACAGQQAARARAARLQQEVGALRYPKPLDEVWPEVKKLLVDRLFVLGGKDAEAFGQPTGLLVGLTSSAKQTTDEPDGLRYLETGWSHYRRYRVEGRPDASGGCRVVFIAILEDYSERFHERARERDYEMELALARRVLPDEANRIDEVVDAAR